MSKLVEAAQEYAILGWQVLPCHPRGKAPLLEHGLLQATADPDQVRWWWSRWPAANIGIRTGDLVDVIDVDSRAGLAALTENAGAHPLSWGPVAQTGRGWHYYLASAGRRTRIGFVPGVDLKAAGGYVIAPPSIHATGRPYRWLRGASPDRLDPQPPPCWLAQLIDPPAAPILPPWTPPEGKSMFEHVRYALAGLRAEAASVATAGEGTRNETLNVAAFKMRRFVEAGHLHPTDVIEALTDAAQAAGLPVLEAQRTICSGLGVRL